MATPSIARGKVAFTFTINRKRVTVKAHPMKRLLDVLRDECGLTGTKEGCGEGECGACTVLMDGITVNSCLVPVVQADGARITSVEGLARRRSLSALQDAFVTMGGAQCGICTPGMLLSAQKLIDESSGVPDEATIREALAGNLCRCTGYQKIIDAVQAAAREERSARRRASAAKSSQSSRRHK